MFIFVESYIAICAIYARYCRVTTPLVSNSTRDNRRASATEKQPERRRLAAERGGEGIKVRECHTSALIHCRQFTAAELRALHRILMRTSRFVSLRRQNYVSRGRAAGEASHPDVFDVVEMSTQSL
ncbi:hypothetical protein EVAR_86838_1 [Eumeta japonica]|uniref:Uncharacterized protein n=1 Tax=Eumeta variegata TaxID=151549 RepID=A0A4C1VRZ2_EUMVA|nr:hypothetical protein EVAR_86838_1 [Eumeta japonica]